jgi:hypothetical protein
MLTTKTTRFEATQRVMAAKLTRLTHKMAIQLHLVAENCTIFSSRSMRPVRQLSDTPFYMFIPTPEEVACPSLKTVRISTVSGNVQKDSVNFGMVKVHNTA